MKRVLFISSSGGHLKELLQLKSTMKKYNSYLVTEKNKTTIDLDKDFKNKIYYLKYGTRYKLNYLYIFPFNCLKSIYLFFKIKPDVVVSTGAHTSVVMCYIAKLFRKKVIYIETFANINQKSLSGKLVYPIADAFIVQWESMLKHYPRAIYGGMIF